MRLAARPGSAIAATDARSSPESRDRLAPPDLLAMAAWSGLAAGWLEVGTRLLARAIDPTHRLTMMSRHYVWMVPLSNLLLFCAAGTLLASMSRIFPRAGTWLGLRVLCAATLLPMFLVASPQIYPWAWLILASGIAMRLAPVLEQPTARRRRWVGWTSLALLAAVPMVAGLVFGAGWYREWRESAGPPAPGDPPNVLLVVLDTVRADHLGLYGYPRNTSQTLLLLAKRGITFTEARATAPWTLASHASLFTGRLPRDLGGVDWMTPLTHDFPTLAGYLGSRGYATAGFVANTQYCSSDTNLDRGFAHYEDYVADLAHLRPLRFAVLFEAGWNAVAALGRVLSAGSGPGRFHDRVESWLGWLQGSYRKDAKEVNREFLDWLARRREPRRPFFAFLNYFDAHAPYILPAGTPLRFGPGPRTLADFTVLVGRWKEIDKRNLSPRYQDLIRDSYDNCLGHLDDSLAGLLNALHRRGELDRTLVIVAADHGEELGDHGLFEHGESLYRPEVRVPLVIVPPPGRPAPEVISEVVSLRDLPATIVDLVGLSAGSPFPGRSLASLWRDPAAASAPPGVAPKHVAVSELATPNPASSCPGLSPATRGPLISLAEGDYVYIRNEGDGREELFDIRQDPAESLDLAGREPLRPILERLRDAARPVLDHPGAGRPGPLLGRGRGTAVRDPSDRGTIVAGRGRLGR